MGEDQVFIVGSTSDRAGRNPPATTKTPPQMICEGVFSLVAGTGFEPATSGL
jgi:hypothetical protein